MYTDDNVYELVTLADEYPTKRIADQCHDFLSRKLPSVRNLVVANTMSWSDIKIKCRKSAMTISFKLLQNDVYYNHLYDEFKMQFLSDKLIQMEDIITNGNKQIRGCVFSEGDIVYNLKNKLMNDTSTYQYESL